MTLKSEVAELRYEVAELSSGELRHFHHCTNGIWPMNMKLSDGRTDFVF